jgi:hypothetical protein
MRRLSLFSAACLALSGLAITPMLGSGTATGSSAHAQAATKGPSGLPLPRFVSLKAKRVNLRIGPGRDYAVAWLYTRSGVPMGMSISMSVAVLHQADGAALGRLRRDVADGQARGAAGEAPVGDQRAGLAQALGLQVAGRVEHLLHAGAALGALVADQHHVAGLDLVGQDGGDGGLLALEDAAPGR